MESFYEKLRHFIIPENVEEPESDQSENETDDTRRGSVFHQSEKYSTEDTQVAPEFDQSENNIENPRIGPVDQLNCRLDCPYCYNVYYTEEHLNSHKRTHHLSKQYTCKWCNIVFTYTGWIYHHKKHTNDKAYSCTSCNKSFFVQQQLQSHLAHHKHSCCFCNETFVTAKQLRAHANSVHDASVISKLFHRRRKRVKSNRNLKPKISQPETPRNETMQRKLPEMNHFERKIEDSESFFHRNKTSIHNSTHRVAKQKKNGIITTKLFECDKCDQKFTKLNFLRDHLKKSFKCRPYWCNDCNAKFIQKKMLEKHVRNHLYKCDSCSRTFSYKHYLDVHRYNEHMLSVKDFAPKTSYRCRYCGSMYASEEDLQNHIKFSGENLIICATCLNVSETEDEFSYHLKNVHGIRELRLLYHAMN